MADQPAPLASVSLVGIITARARAAATSPQLFGTITARAGAAAAFPQLYGTITARARARAALLTVTYPTITRVNLQGTIGGAAQVSIGALQTTGVPVFLYGTITSRGSTELWTGPGVYTTTLSGQISGTSWLEGLAEPRQNILIGRITAESQTQFSIAEVQDILPPYPEPFLTFETLDYLDKITSEHNQRPKYMASVTYSVDPIVQDQQLVAGLSGLFDLDYCVGEQEDFTGQWIGKSRWIEIPSPFFSWDTQGLGWNEANWKGPADSDNFLERLDDYHYRLLLYAQVIANHWNGSIPAAYEAWDTLFKFTGIKVVIQDYGDMTMLYGFLTSTQMDVILLNLFTTGQMNLKPEGVELRAYALQAEPNAPFFAWDSASDSVLGWDTGSWGIMVTPGTAYVPYEGETR